MATTLHPMTLGTHNPPEIRFAQARGARLAYQQHGDGPDVVAIPPLAQNIELAWERPEIRAMLERFGRFSRFTPFDKRGTGASDKRSQVVGIDERVDDLRAVMDEADVDRAHLFVQSEGGPMAVLFAASYPDRVQSLIFHGSGPYTAPRFGSDAERAETIERIEVGLSNWGTSDSRYVEVFAPSLFHDEEFRKWHQRYERNAATTDSLRELTHMMFDVDVTELLPSLNIPTLVLHRVGDRAVPIEWGRLLADGIPEARMVELEGDDHFAYAGDLDTWMDEVEEWVTGSIQETPSLSRPEVRVRTLGEFQVDVGTQTVEKSAWGSRRARQLCKRLIAARGWPVTRDELFDMLWPDEPDPSKLGPRLSVQLSTVRRILNGGVISDRESVRLDLDEVSSDLEDFLGTTDDTATFDAYTGEFLPEDRYEDWAGSTRDEARSHFVSATRRLAVSAYDDGEFELSATYSRGLIEADRYDSQSHELLIRSLLAQGETGQANQAHCVYDSAMSELDIEAPTLSDLKVF